jgi:hypothetical protein
MIAYAGHPATTVISVPAPALSGEAARALALGFLRYASACWRGEEAARHFATRLGAYWRPQMPPMPTTPADDFSPHGAGGRGIAWYQTGDEVRGYIPGRGCGYRVPVDAIQRLARCVPTGPCPRPEGALVTWKLSTPSEARRGSA